MRNTIFTLERRLDFKKAFNAFLDNLTNTTVHLRTGSKMRIESYLEHCICFWPFRCGSNSIDEYMRLIDIDMENLKNETECLYALELIINLLNWAIIQENVDFANTPFSFPSESTLKNEVERLLENADYILEQGLNMRVEEREKDGFSQYFIRKRDSAVDAVIDSVPELSEVLLGYLDFRNQNDYKYKKNALITIYDYMEPNRKRYKGLACSAISEEFFTAINKFGIRHNTKTQIRLHYTKRNALYDKLFKMALYVIQTETVYSDKDFIKQLRTDSETNN